MMVHSRSIGKYEGKKSAALIIVTAAMHGNEVAGVKALELVFKMLEMEKKNNPAFTFDGVIIGLIGNMQAYQQGKRYICKDINRMWTPEIIKSILSKPIDNLKNESKEIYELIIEINTAISEVKPSKIYLLDIHTTSSDGIFCIEGGEEESREIALQIKAPLVTGLMQGLSGTTLHYFDYNYLGIPSVTLAFEGGHHDDPLSVNRCMAAVFQFLRATKVINAQALIGTYDYILNFNNLDMPEKVKVNYRHHVENASEWEMLPGFKNFDTIYEGQLLATYMGNEIYAPMSGYILMPLYQNQGNDGFFVCIDAE